MTARAIAIAAGFALAMPALALAALPSTLQDTTAGAAAPTNAADNESQRSFTVAQRPPKQRQPSNDGWGDIDPYSFGWRDGANTG